MKEFTENGITIKFYREGNDKKYRFKVSNNDELTDAILSKVKTHRVPERGIRYAKIALFDLIWSGELNVPTQKKESVAYENPVTELNLRVQKQYRESIVFNKLSKEGEDHNPICTVELSLPNGKTYTGIGGSFKRANTDASKKALAEWELL